MKTFLFATAAAIALTFAGSDAAQAGDFHGGFGGYYGGGHIHHDVNPWINPGYGHLHYHDTTHYDYIPGRWVQHGCHRHWIPGRWVLHVDGHFDLHH